MRSSETTDHDRSAAATTLRDRKRVVLVVEDDRDVLDALAVTLEETDYEVLRAHNGLEALGQLEAHPCDLILLDLMMPVMNGWDFRHKQKETPKIAKIPVLLMSAGAHLSTASGELDAVGYVTKPVDVSDLLDIVRQHCP
jgi:two-component system, chemotaxis family, chemotaxis protein CheY